MSDEKWPRTPDITDDLTDGSVRRVWYVGGPESNCTHVEVWMPKEAVQMFFSAKGCVDVRKYWNGATPELHEGEDDCQYVHICDAPEFAATLLRGLEHATGHWKKI